MYIRILFMSEFPGLRHIVKIRDFCTYLSSQSDPSTSKKKTKSLHLATLQIHLGMSATLQIHIEVRQGTLQMPDTWVLFRYPYATKLFGHSSDPPFGMPATLQMPDTPGYSSDTLMPPNCLATLQIHPEPKEIWRLLSALYIDPWWLSRLDSQ